MKRKKQKANLDPNERSDSSSPSTESQLSPSSDSASALDNGAVSTPVSQSETSASLSRPMLIILLMSTFILGFFLGFSYPAEDSNAALSSSPPPVTIINDEGQTPFKPIIKNRGTQRNERNVEVKVGQLFNNVTIIDLDARMFYYPHFLTEEEVDFVMNAGIDLLGESHGKTWRVRMDRAVAYFSTPEMKVHPIIKAIEEKVAIVTNSPIHDDELDLMFAFNKPYQLGHEITNVHHDLNGSENRVMTVVIYLNDVQQGGYTMFPCIGDHVANKDLRETFAKAFFSETRRTLYPPPHWNDTAFRVCNQMCLGSIPAVRIKPQKGAAVVFPSRSLDGNPDAKMWHAACRPIQGEKFTLQKFKEFARENGEWKHHESWTMETGSSIAPTWVPKRK